MNPNKKRRAMRARHQSHCYRCGRLIKTGDLIGQWENHWVCTDCISRLTPQKETP